MNRFVIAAVAALALSACAGNPPPVTVPAAAGAPVTTAPAPSPLERLAQFTINDLQAADADAVAHNDAIGHACYPALIKFVQDNAGTLGGNVAGAFSAFQRARDIGRDVNAGVPDYLKLGCAPLVVDVQVMVARLAAIGTGAAATAGASVLIPAPFPIQ